MGGNRENPDRLRIGLALKSFIDGMGLYFGGTKGDKRYGRAGKIMWEQ